MADDKDHKPLQSDQPEGEPPECSSGGMLGMATGSPIAAECGAADSDDEDEHLQRDKFRGERSEYNRRSVKDWVDSSRGNTRSIRARLTLPSDKNRVCGITNGDDELEYSSISSQDSFDDAQYDEPNLPGKEAGSTGNTSGEAGQTRELGQANGDDQLEYSSISSKESLADEFSSTHSDRAEGPTTTTEATHTRECKVGDGDDELEYSSISSKDSLGDVDSNISDDELMASPDHTTNPGQNKECIADGSDDRPQHKQLDGDGQDSSKSAAPRVVLGQTAEMYPKANNISKAWLVVNGQTSPIEQPAISKPVILSSIESRCHVLLQVKLTTNDYPKFIIGAFIHQMARNATWVYNHPLDRWETIICQGETSEGDTKEDCLDRLSHSSGQSTKTDQDKDDDMVDSDDVQQPRSSPSPTLSSVKDYHPEANNISRAWVIIDGQMSTINALNKSKAIITTALKYHRHVLIQVRLSMSSPRLSLGAFIVSIAGKATWSYNSISHRWEAAIGLGEQRQLEEDVKNQYSEDQCSSQDTRLFDPEPTLPNMLNFRDFLVECEDSITEEEAIRKYSDYKQSFEGQEPCDLETHEEEEWMVLEEWRDDRRDADEGSGGGDGDDHVPSPDVTMDSDHSVQSTEANREDQKDLDEGTGSGGPGDRVPSPDHTQESNPTQEQANGADS